MHEACVRPVKTSCILEAAKCGGIKYTQIRVLRRGLQPNLSDVHGLKQVLEIMRKSHQRCMRGESLSCQSASERFKMSQHQNKCVCACVVCLSMQICFSSSSLRAKAELGTLSSGINAQWSCNSPHTGVPLTRCLQEHLPSEGCECHKGSFTPPEERNWGGVIFVASPQTGRQEDTSNTGPKFRK